jgi:hypothetical protein
MRDEPLRLESVLKEESAAIRGAGDPTRPLSALCISGGGIRSATFALGAVQSLAEHGLLGQFDYLSTVSGGGYLGAWLSAWATRLKSIDGVTPHLRSDAEPPGPGEPDPIQHLREYNNYLSPKLGAFSADTWTLIATVTRNIALNWLVLIPLLLCFMMAPRILLYAARLSETYYDLYGRPNLIANSPEVEWVLPVLVDLLFCYGLFYIFKYLPGVGGVNHTGGDFIKRVLAPLAASTVLYCAYDALHYWSDDYGALTASQYILLTLVPSAITWIVFLLLCGKPLAERLSLFRRLSLAIVLLSISLGAAEWLVTTRFVPTIDWPEYVTLVPPLIGLTFYAALAIFAGISSLVLEDKDREWLSRAASGILLACAGWLLACLLVLEAPRVVLAWRTWSGPVVAVVGTLAGWATTLTRKDGDVKGPAWTGIAIKIAPAVFVVALAIALALLTDIIVHVLDPAHAPWTQHTYLLENTSCVSLLSIAAIFFAVAWVSARYININKFSLHGMYRDRLIRAYLGASNPQRFEPEDKIVDGGPNRFTGFAQTDNIAMHDLIHRPFHVVNVTLNLVAGKRLAWQQRKAQSFTMTPLHCGNYCVGYRPSEGYGEGISLGTAITVSGAAASPNMGYHSSPATGFLMTLLNARLGAWFGNPGPAGKKTWKLAGPRTAIGSLLKEAFGLTTNDSEYVYLSDGGHFENLALYEMVMRRCKYIIVLDNGCDENFTYEDLGNALRKIRIDFRIRIDFDGGVSADKRCAVATIRYPDGEFGHLVYVKPKMLGDEPPDVTSYSKANPTFPHQSTADQWFDESQTESYRMLGKFTMDSICETWDPSAPLADFPRYVSSEYLGVKQSSATAT